MYIHKNMCHRESSRTPQHSTWNCVGAKQATAHAHVQSRCMWLNFEHHQKIRTLKKIALTKIEFEARLRPWQVVTLLTTASSGRRFFWRSHCHYVITLLACDLSSRGTRCGPACLGGASRSDDRTRACSTSGGCFLRQLGKSCARAM